MYAPALVFVLAVMCACQAPFVVAASNHEDHSAVRERRQLGGVVDAVSGLLGGGGETSSSSNSNGYQSVSNTNNQGTSVNATQQQPPPPAPAASA